MVRVTVVVTVVMVLVVSWAPLASVSRVVSEASTCSVIVICSVVDGCAEQPKRKVSWKVRCVLGERVDRPGLEVGAELARVAGGVGVLLGHGW